MKGEMVCSNIPSTTSLPPPPKMHEDYKKNTINHLQQIKTERKTQILTCWRDIVIWQGSCRLAHRLPLCPSGFRTSFVLWGDIASKLPKNHFHGCSQPMMMNCDFLPSLRSKCVPKFLTTNQSKCHIRFWRICLCHLKASFWTTTDYKLEVVKWHIWKVCILCWCHTFDNLFS